MFDRVSVSEHVLLFHTSASADQAGAARTLRQADVVFTSDSVSLGKYGPFALPSEVRDARELQQLMALSDNTVRVGGKSKSPGSHPDRIIQGWLPIVNYRHFNSDDRIQARALERDVLVANKPLRKGRLSPPKCSMRWPRT